jgi:flagellar motor switch protein FliG
MTKYSPIEKAAIILVSLGEEVAADVLKHFDSKEVRRLARLVQLFAKGKKSG